VSGTASKRQPAAPEHPPVAGNAALLGLGVLGTVPALVFRLGLGAHIDPKVGLVWAGGALSPPLTALVFGLAVLAAAFLISWAAELLQLDISQNLAMAIVALLAVLPEYSVDMYLAWTAATVPENIPLALANMTGANRLLIGLGWPALALAVLWRFKRHQVELEESRWGEIFVLAVATVYSFLLPLKGTLTLLDTVIFLAIFAFYIRYASRQEVIEPDLGGPAELIAELPRVPRRFAAAALFVLAGTTLLASAEPFAEGLKLTGHSWGISEFLLIQWLAPIASEAPEFIIALVFALRGMASAGFGALVSSKVNQWTLLVGMVPLAYAAGLVAHGKPIATLPLDARQLGELLLTSAQSIFAVMIVLDRRFKLDEMLLLLGLFLAQFGVSIGIEEWVAPASQQALFNLEKGIFSAVYLLLAGVWLVRHRQDARRLVKFAMGA
jgi:cation:H+ antiporter